MKPGRRAMRVIAAGELAAEIAADRLGEELAVRREADRDEPGQHDRQHQRHAPARPQPAEPGRTALPQAERGRGERRRPSA